IFCRQILPLIKQKNPFISTYKKSEIVDYPTLTEPFIHAELGKQFPKEYSVFFANSMPVRNADLFFFPKHPPKEMFFHRVLSGIHGNIATCVGISRAIQTPLIAVLGDLTALHDLNSFAFAKKNPFPISFFISNNQGGGIFSHLPIARMKHSFETFFAAK